MALSKIESQALDVGQIGGRRNLIINGAMQVAQRGTSFTTSSAYPVDRFGVDTSVASVTKSQESLTSGDAYDVGFRKFLRLTNTSAATSTSSFQRIVYKVEAQDMASSGWNYTDSTSYITFSFWVRSSLAGTYHSYILSNDSPVQAYSFSYTVSANTWTKVTKTIPGNANIVINPDNGIGLQIETWLFGGTNFTDPTNVIETWAAYNSSNRMPDFAQDWGNTAGATFDLTGVQLEVGSVATPFEHRSYGEELALCQRYYQRRGATPAMSGSYYAMMGDGMFWDNADTAFINFEFPVDMRAAPSVESGGTFRLVGNGTSYTGISSFVVQWPTTYGMRINASGSGYPATKNACFLQPNNNSSSYIAFNAEL